MIKDYLNQKALEAEWWLYDQKNPIEALLVWLEVAGMAIMLVCIALVVLDTVGGML